MARSGLMVKVRRPLSPDAKFEVPAHQEDYERVKQIVDDEGEMYPRLCGMAFELVAQIRDEVKYRLGINTDVTRGISTMTDSEMSRGTQNGLTTRAWDSDSALR
ncbi:hypothetical protein V1519DRAFT_433656, partial [Lipomyces tetrasporus]